MECAGRDAAAAFDAALELVDLFGHGVVHALLFPGRIELLGGVNPGLGFLVHLAEPDARVHGQVADELEDGQGHERDGLGQVLGLGLAGQARTAVDDHGAGPADAGPAAEVENIKILIEQGEYDQAQLKIDILLEEKPSSSI